MLTERSIAALADAARRSFQFSEQNRPDMMTLIVKMKEKYSEFDYLRVADEEMEGNEAQYDSSRKLLRLAESTFVAMQRNEARARFTVVHEIAHALLRHKGILNRNTDRRAYEIAAYRQREREADIFAGHFLVPLGMLSKSMTPAEVAKRFGVSIKVAEIQLSKI
jgi:Zn-dependent peptidase ImmA (M78 family)